VGSRFESPSDTNLKYMGCSSRYAHPPVGVGSECDTEFFVDGPTLNRGSTQMAAIDHPGPNLTDHIDPLGPPPLSSDVAARVAWQIAKRQTERNAPERQTP